MALSFASSTGAFFNRIGKIGALIKNLRSYQNTQLSAMTDTTNGVVAQFNSESDIQAIMGTSYLGILAAVGGIGSTAQSLATETLNRMIFRDNAQLNQNLTSLNTVASLRELIRQMKVAGATVLAATVAGTATAFTGDGNGAAVVSTVRPFDGKSLENLYAETITLLCTDDSYTGGAAAGSEGFAITGQGNQSDVFAFNWPLGSNVQVSGTAINAAADNGANLLTNSDFEDWTGGKPDHFALTVGAADVNVVEETTITFGGTAALRIVGDGAGTNTTLQQEFADSTDGTAGQLAPATQYGVCLWMRRDGVAPAAGVLTISLVDENGTVLVDENSVANTFNIALTGLTTDYASYTGVFRTPYILPTTSFLRLQLSTALTSGRSVYVARLSLGQMTQLYASGPFLSIHSGSLPFAAGDRATVTTTNSRGAAGTLDSFQTLTARLFPEVLSQEFLLPSAAVPSISDLLIS